MRYYILNLFAPKTYQPRSGTSPLRNMSLATQQYQYTAVVPDAVLLLFVGRPDGPQGICRYS